MNIIEAWKKADGKTIKNGNRSYSTKKSLKSIIDDLPGDGYLVSDKWEIVKEKKVVKGTISYNNNFSFCYSYSISFSQPVPLNATITAEWEE